jgi:hypothetical protein
MYGLRRLLVAKPSGLSYFYRLFGRAPVRRMADGVATFRARYSLGPASVPNVLGTDLVAHAGARAPAHRSRDRSGHLL